MARLTGRRWAAALASLPPRVNAYASHSIIASASRSASLSSLLGSSSARLRFPGTAAAFRPFGTTGCPPLPVSSSAAAATSASATSGGDYLSVHGRSISAPEQFWHAEALKLRWFQPPSLERCLTSTVPGIRHRWFSDGVCNITDQCLDYHCDSGRGDQTALIWDSPATGSKASYTYAELRDWVSSYAGLLRSQGVTKGSVVAIYMPMIPAAAVAMLAAARLGAMHVVVFGGFSAEELGKRLQDTKPTVVVTATGGIEVAKLVEYKPIVDEALRLCAGPAPRVVVHDRPELRALGHKPRVPMKEGRDVFYADLASDPEKFQPVPPVHMNATDPLYMLHTSGTTGKPKGIVRDHGSSVMMKYTMGALFDAPAGATVACFSDLGWIVGHHYILYAPLLNGNATVLFEGKPTRTPDAGAYWRVAAEHGARIIFSAPTAFRAIRKEDSEASLAANYDLSKLKAVFVAGERCDPSTFDWIQSVLPKCSVVDNMWMTETGSPILGNPLGIFNFPAKPGSATKPLPGFNLAIASVDHEHDGKESGKAVTLLGDNEEGSLVIKSPLPPSFMATIFGDHQRMFDTYFKQVDGYFLTGDSAYRDSDGYYFVMGREDDVIKVAGHRLSSGQMEEVLASHNDVAEAAVIALPDEIKGAVPVGHVVLKDGAKDVDESRLERELVALVRDKIGPVAVFKNVVVLKRLPKTRSGKILRKTMRNLCETPIEMVKYPPTIDDVSVLAEIAEVYKNKGVGPLWDKKK